MREEIRHNSQSESKSESLHTAVDRQERRRLIRAAMASVPVVLTFSAGTAHAQDVSVVESGVDSDTPADDVESIDSGGSDVILDENGEPLTPAEELETFGLERVDRPEDYDEDPYRNLDSIHPEVDYDSFDSP